MITVLVPNDGNLGNLVQYNHSTYVVLLEQNMA